MYCFAHSLSRHRFFKRVRVYASHTRQETASACLSVLNGAISPFISQVQALPARQKEGFGNETRAECYSTRTSLDISIRAKRNILDNPGILHENITLASILRHKNILHAISPSNDVFPFIQQGNRCQKNNEKIQNFTIHTT